MLWLNVKAIDFLFQIQWAIILLDNNELPKIYLQHSLSISKLGVVLQCTSNSTDNIIESSIQSLHLSTFYSFHMCCVDSGCFNCNLVRTIFDQSWLTADIIPLCIKFFLNREHMTFFTRVFVCLFVCPNVFRETQWSFCKFHIPAQILCSNLGLTKDENFRLLMSWPLPIWPFSAGSEQGLPSSHTKPVF